MRLKVIGSGSAGNSYVVYNDTETLIIECGVRFQLIKQALNFNLHNVSGCLITHSHQDHCKGVKDVLSAGIDVYCLPETAEAFGIPSYRINKIETLKSFKVGNFTVKAFPLQHDVPCVGYHITHEETGQFCFITDSYYCQYVFKNLSNIIVEANYCDKILQARMDSGVSPQFLRDRVVQSHMSLETCKGFLKANDLSKINNILLIHLSDSNSNAVQFKKEVRDLTLANVHIAEKGLDIEWNKTPF